MAKTHTAIPMMVQFETRLTTDQLLEYLKGQELFVILQPYRNWGELSRLPLEERRARLLEISSNPPRFKQDKQEVIPLPQNWNQLTYAIYCYSRLDYCLSVTPKNCPRIGGDLRITDAFFWEKGREGEEGKYVVNELGIGVYPVCVSECGKFLNRRTSCGRYFARKAQHSIDMAAT